LIISLLIINFTIKIYMQKLYRHSLSLLPLAFFVISISSCSSSTSTTPPTQGKVSPKTGSSFTYAGYKDTAGMKVPNSDTTYSAIVEADSLTLFGQPNAYTIFDRGDTIDMAYASNNDVMIYYQSTGLNGLFQSIGDAVFHRWITLSVSSKTTSVTVLDTTLNVVVSGFSVPAKVTLTSNYIGDTTIAVGSEIMTTNHCRITAIAVSNSPLLSPAVTYSNQRDIYFAKKIGYAAEVTTNEVIPTVTQLSTKGRTTGTFKVLTSYTVK
jgi:hypothetical protein